ncbi:Mom family adenine methylcarbamoylation protein [Microbacterium testaceum]|uniref:Mom family adenine methylcarbamoylation protein n=1 Tax=Microbacterium testaceum TaxID=2033 RepID=UPI002AC49B3B|nr:hypothetical protein [Microbacterium testaceum]MDZ5146299.1 hypothetical protein [Microbacterium testaceum]
MPPLPSTTSTACQRWTLGRHSWRHVSEGGFDRRRFTVTPIPEATARAFVRRHHYSGSYPAARFAWGLFTDDQTLADNNDPLVGVAVLSIPMRAAVLTNVFTELTPLHESLELGRFVLTDPVPANAESWFLAQVWKHAAAAGIRGVVAFADPLRRQRTITDIGPDGHLITRTETLTPGHVGTIYQATGAISLGRSTARTLNYVPSAGIVLSERTLSKIRTSEQGCDAAERHLVTLGARTRRAHEDPRS